MRLFVVVEGQTEQEFIENVLAPWLYGRVTGLSIEVRIVETSRDAAGHKRAGGGRWKHWYKDLSMLLRTQRGSDVRVTTLFDLYGLPGDFPSLVEHRAVADTSHRAQLLETAMAEAVLDERLIPYIQRHEFEALVLASIEQLAGIVDPADARGVKRLRELCRHVLPEDVNDGPETAPSKRLQQQIGGYRKTVHGVLAVQDAGISALVDACPRFAAWVHALLVLGEPVA